MKLKTKKGNDELIVFFPKGEGHLINPFTASYSDRCLLENKPVSDEDNSSRFAKNNKNNANTATSNGNSGIKCSHNNS